MVTTNGVIVADDKPNITIPRKPGFPLHELRQSKLKRGVVIPVVIIADARAVGIMEIAVGKKLGVHAKSDRVYTVRKLNIMRAVWMKHMNARAVYSAHENSIPSGMNVRGDEITPVLRHAECTHITTIPTVTRIKNGNLKVLGGINQAVIADVNITRRYMQIITTAYRKRIVYV